MRFFEVGMAASAAISIFNLIFMPSSRAGLLLSAVSAAAAACSILAEGYRIFMLPAYLLSLILLVQSTIRFCRCKYNADSKLSESTGSEMSEAFDSRLSEKNGLGSSGTSDSKLSEINGLGSSDNTG